VEKQSPFIDQLIEIMEISRVTNHRVTIPICINNEIRKLFVRWVGSVTLPPFHS